MSPFEGREIYQIVIISGQGVGIVNIDDKCAKIEDKSIEYENSLHNIYHCYDHEGGIFKVIENCPVDISYRKIQETK